MTSKPYRAEYDGGKLLAEYVYANGQRIAKIDAGGDVDYYLNDHLGSARAMAGSKWSAKYYPFGEIASQGGSQEDTRYDFTGKERDRGTGLHYFGARYYDSEIGRWVSADPLMEFSPSITPYQYTRNNPINRVDLWGMFDTGERAEDDPEGGSWLTIEEADAETGVPEGCSAVIYGNDVVYLLDQETPLYKIYEDLYQARHSIHNFLGSFSVSLLKNYDAGHKNLHALSQADALKAELLTKIKYKGVPITPKVAMILDAWVAAMSDAATNNVENNYLLDLKTGVDADTEYYDPSGHRLIMRIIHKDWQSDSLYKVRLEFYKWQR